MRISWSGLRTFIECPYKFQKKYLDGVQEKQVFSTASEYGTKIHDELLRERKIKLPANLQILGTEVHIAGVFEGEREPITLEGIVDVIAKDDDGLVIIDVKTYYPSKKDFLQVNFYAFILSALKKQKVSKLYIYETNRQELIEVPDLTKEVHQKIILLQSSVGETNLFPVNPGEHCRFCGYVEICPLQRNIWANITMTEEEVFKMYLYIQELEKRLTDKLKEFAKDHEVKYDKYIAKYDVLKSFKLKPVEKEQIYSKYGLEAFEIDKEFLKQAEPSLFEIIEKKTLKITKKEDE